MVLKPGAWHHDRHADGDRVKVGRCVRVEFSPFQLIFRAFSIFEHSEEGTTSGGRAAADSPGAPYHFKVSHLALFQLNPDFAVFGHTHTVPLNSH